MPKPDARFSRSAAGLEKRTPFDSAMKFIVIHETPIASLRAGSGHEEDDLIRKNGLLYPPFPSRFLADAPPKRGV